ncbi:MAG: DUF368 domain-containing protein [Dethiobacteria bacterium]
MLLQFLQGMAIGIAFVLPGLSAGTVILILGFYKQFIDDLSRLRLRPYLPHLCGAALSALVGVKIIGYLLENYNDLLSAFLLGMVVASIRVIIIHNGKIVKPTFWGIILGAAAFLITWFIFSNPTPGWTALPAGSPHHFFIGGALAAATMILPGISGSSTLVMMNLYDDMIFAVNHWEWLKITIFSAGALIGIFVFARLLSALYHRYHDTVSLVLVGLLLGATRSLLPSTLSAAVIVSALIGAAIVLVLSSPGFRQPKQKTSSG